LNQVAYAWYSFDTTNGAAVSTATLLGGTGIYEGSGQPVGANVDGYNRGTGDTYFGDLIYFNSDGSLASMGGVQDAAGVLTQCQAHVYLPAAQVLNPPDPATPASPIPTLGAEIMDITMNFGTAGYTAANVAGAGANGIPLAGTIVGARRDGLFSDAEGSYQVINGVNTYVADSHATTSQNGYADGTLTSLSFDETGTIQGQFSNGQTTALGQVLMASVENINGLDQVGDNYYQAGPNAGAQTLGLAGKNGMGSIQGGYLENSNVDLTTELSNMIIAQRGFDVNSRVIAVENANLQVLTQLGQGG
jgi:flagellar hook protein FlgE